MIHPNGFQTNGKVPICTKVCFFSFYPIFSCSSPPPNQWFKQNFKLTQAWIFGLIFSEFLSSINLREIIQYEENPSTTHPPTYQPTNNMNGTG